MPINKILLPVQSLMRKRAVTAALTFPLLCGPLDSSAQGLTLAQALQQAATQSEEVLVAQEQVKRFESVKEEAYATAYPQVNFYANGGRAHLPMDPSSFGQRNAPVFSVEQDRFTYGLEVNQALYTFGRLSQAIRVAKVQEEANQVSALRARQQAQLMALDAYYAVITSESHLRTLESSHARQRETVAFLEQNFRLGAGNRADVLRAVSALKALEPERIRAERDAEIMRMHLNRLLGRPVDAEVVLDTAQAFLAMEKGVLESESDILTSSENRSDLKALRLQREALEQTARLMRMQSLPTLGAQGKFGFLNYDRTQLGQLVDWDHVDWQVGIGLQWNLFDGFGNRSRSRQFQSDARTVGLQERMARKQTKIEVTGALREVQAADTALSAATQSVEAAREAQSLISDEFRAGKGNLTDLLTAEEALQRAEFGLLNARYLQVRSGAALKVALGKDLVKEEDL